jgi:glucose/arabinose dehydrogenase
MPPLSLALAARLARAAVSSLRCQHQASSGSIRSTVCAVALLLFAYSTLCAAELPAGFAETLVADGLSAPTAMALAPDGRLFVCQQGGQVRVIKNDTLLPTPFLSIAVDSAVERGLLGIAFDPEFATNHFVYLYYTTATAPIHNRISRFTADADVAVAGSETVIFELDNLSSSARHSGGAMNFRNDGYLYIAVGDDRNNSNAQSLTNPFGKILRINKDGTIPTSNPFYSTATSNNRAIWAMGLRNPFTFAIQPGTGLMYINDVGEENWEEINEGTAGANYGWPLCEGKCTDPRPSFTDPLSQYGHGFSADTGCAITGGAFYNPAQSQFPSDYVGNYFFGDYCGGWIRRLDPASETVSDFITGIASPVGIQVGADGSLYYLAIGNGGAVYKVQRNLDEEPSITRHPSNQFVTWGRKATFSVSAYGAVPLAYQWQKNGVDVAGATSATYVIQPARLVDDGAQIRCIVSNSFGSATSNSATLNVTTNRAPTGNITAPTGGMLFKAGDTINYAGTGTDPEEGDLPPSAFTWQVDFHHDTHKHPFMPPTSGSRSGSFVIPRVGETATNVWYRVYLTVQDTGGFTHTSYRDIKPRTAKITLTTKPAGLRVSLDGRPQTAPSSVYAVVGSTRTIGVETTQVMNGLIYRFVSWSDRGADTHDMTTLSVDKTYTALFQPIGINQNHVISFDFDGDEKTDIGIWQPATRAWITLHSSNGLKVTTQLASQNPGDQQVPADYDGDGKTDCATWRPSDNVWRLYTCSGSPIEQIVWGLSGDLPVPGDYDGDGRAEIGVFRPSDGNWHIMGVHNHTVTSLQWGTSEDQPVLGDYDGDGKADFGVWRPSVGTWYILTNPGGNPLIIQMGMSGDLPAPGDYDGDGKTDPAIFRPGSATWQIRQSSDGALVTRQWGVSTDKVAPGDYDGDGKTDIAVRRPSTGTFYILMSSNGQSLTKRWGSQTTNDVPIPSAYTR